MDATPTTGLLFDRYDPLTNATQASYRQFTGVHTLSGAEATIQAWVIAFQQHPHSRARYRRIERMLSTVDGQARAPELIAGIDHTLQRLSRADRPWRRVHTGVDRGIRSAGPWSRFGSSAAQWGDGADLQHLGVAIP